MLYGLSREKEKKKIEIIILSVILNLLKSAGKWTVNRAGCLLIDGIGWFNSLLLLFVWSSKIYVWFCPSFFNCIPIS